MNIRKVTLQKLENKYSNANNRWTIVPELKVEDDKYVIFKRDVEELKENLRKIKNRNSTIPPNSKVFFSSEVTYPRRKFNTCYEKEGCKLSTNKTADVIVVDFNKLANELRHFYYRQYIDIDGQTLRQRELNGMFSFPVMGNEQNIDLLEVHPKSTSYKTFESAIQIVNDNKCIVDVSNVKIGTEELLEESIERIDKMLESNDSSMVNMGIRLLTAYDYDKEKLHIVRMINKNYTRIAGASKNVEVQGLLRKIEIDFPGYHRQDIHGRTEFLLNLGLNYNDDASLHELAKMMKADNSKIPDFKIVKV